MNCILRRQKNIGNHVVHKMFNSVNLNYKKLRNLISNENNINILPYYILTQLVTVIITIVIIVMPKAGSATRHVKSFLSTLRSPFSYTSRFAFFNTVKNLFPFSSSFSLPLKHNLNRIPQHTVPA